MDPNQLKKDNVYMYTCGGSGIKVVYQGIDKRFKRITYAFKDIKGLPGIRTKGFLSALSVKHYIHELPNEQN